MFDRVSQAAEKLATNVSRRAFMGGLGKGALALAGAMGAMLAFPGLVQAGGGACCPPGYGWVCEYAGGITTSKCPCNKTYKGMPLIGAGCVGPI
jgi:hypothetical protein